MIPKFSVVDFFSLYIEIPIMLFMYTLWVSLHRIPALKRIFLIPTEPIEEDDEPTTSTSTSKPPKRVRWFDLVDTVKVDLYVDEHHDEAIDHIDDQEREQRLSGRFRWFWKVYYLVA